MSYAQAMKALLICLLFPALAASAGAWPPGRLCAVSLTYDDGLDSQILNAAFDLNQAGLKGTFFPTGSSPMVLANPAPWKALAAQGHELGSHTMIHPCSKSMAFVKKGNALEDYDDARMSKELDDSIAFLQGLGFRHPRSFAYPCGATQIGEGGKKHSYTPLVSARFRFVRGVGNLLADPATVDLGNTPGWDGSSVNIQGWKAVIERAKSQGAWLIIMFHGVGGDYLKADESDHQELLKLLKKEQASVWTVPFGQAAAAVEAYQKSLKAGR